MELTNHSYLNSRNNYLSSLSSQKLSAEKFASGKKLDRSGTDVGALSQASNRRIELLNDRASIVNLKMHAVSSMHRRPVFIVFMKCTIRLKCSQ